MECGTCVYVISTCVNSTFCRIHIEKIVKFHLRMLGSALHTNFVVPSSALCVLSSGVV